MLFRSKDSLYEVNEILKVLIKTSKGLGSVIGYTLKHSVIGSVIRAIVGGVEYLKSSSPKKEKPDIIILDIHLQGGSGLGIQYLIHSQKLNIKTVILTNYSSPILQEKSFELGAKYFLDKSRDFSKLKETLINIIEDKE